MISIIIRYNTLKLIHCHLSMSEKQVCNKNEKVTFLGLTVCSRLVVEGLLSY